MCKASLGQIIDYVNEKAAQRSRNTEQKVRVRKQHPARIFKGEDLPATFTYLEDQLTTEVDLKCLNCLDNLLPGAANVP